MITRSTRPQFSDRLKPYCYMATRLVSLFMVSVLCLTNDILPQRKEIGPAKAKFAFPPTVLAYIRHLVSGDIKGEIREVCTTIIYCVRQYFWKFIHSVTNNALHIITYVFFPFRTLPSDNGTILHGNRVVGCQPINKLNKDTLPSSQS